MRSRQVDAWRIDCHARLRVLSSSAGECLPCKGTGEISKKCKDCTDWGHMTLVVTARRKR